MKENEFQIEKLETISVPISQDVRKEPFVIDREAATNLWGFFEILRRWKDEEGQNGKD